jgi:eukaryotic-like serine/threonine-protein kinase
MMPQRCPDAEMLRRLLAEQLHGTEAQTVEAHVETCADCQGALEVLTPGADQRPGLQVETVPAFLLRLEDDPPTGATPLTQPIRCVPAVAGYEIIQELGRGGMGVVYLARQIRLNRMVAIKMILAGGQAGDEELARFRAEAEAVARLQHPNIVQIHEVGEQDGRPFFVLEYVDGGSLDRMLAGTPQLARPAAELVEALARAMHLAHQKGVVHRDLKPANVLLSVGQAALLATGGTGKQGCLPYEPKVTDFGLAKRLDLSLAATRTGAIMGTPSYMAPEQALGRNEEVGPAADVYALGAILYECLTGRPPFRGESPLDTLQQVVASEPVAPRQLQPKVSRDLETVCLKCLQKEPRKRYASALEMAEDLRRFLNNEPIRARPVGPAGRLWRWCRRNPAVASLVAALALGTVGGLVVMTGLYLHAREQTQQAEQQRDRAEESFRQTLGVVDKYLTNVGESAELKAVGLERFRRRLLVTAQEFYERFTRERGGDPRLRANLGDAYNRLGFISAALGESENAAEMYGRTQGVFAGLVRDHPNNPDYLAELARSHHDLAATCNPMGRQQEAEANYMEARRLREQLVKDHPNESRYQAELAQTVNNFAILYNQSGRQAEAEASFREADALRDRLARAHPEIPSYQDDLAESLAIRGVRLMERGELGPARESHEQARRICAGLTQAHQGVPRYRSHLARSLFHLAQLDGLQGRKAQAVKGYQHAEELFRQLAREHPYVLDYQNQWATSLLNRGEVHLTAGEPDSAESPLQEARKLYARLRDAQPRVLEYGLALAKVCGNLGHLCYTKERRIEAERFFQEARDLLTPHVRDHPELVEVQSDMASTCNNLGAIYRANGRYPEAEAAYSDARKARETLLQTQPKVLQHQYHLGTTWLNLGTLYVRMDRPEDAARALGEARRISGGLARKHPEVPDLQDVFAISLTESGRVALAAGRPTDAESAFKEACTTREALARRFPDVVAYQVEVGKNQYRVGVGYGEADEPDRSLEWLGRAVRTLEELDQKRPKDAVIQPALRDALWDRAIVLKRRGRPADALKDFDRALKLSAGEQRLRLRAWRTVVLILLGEQGQAMAEVEELTRTKDVPAGAHYSLACTHALAAAAVAGNTKLAPAERTEQAERHSVRAVEMLGKALAGGYFKTPVNRTWLKKEGDLKSLHGREAFKKMLRQVEEQAKLTHK